MATINFVVPRLNKKRFTGGLWCLFEYAAGLRSKGHTVNVVPMLPSVKPEWFGRDFGQLISERLSQRVSRVLKGAVEIIPASMSISSDRRRLQHAASEWADSMLALVPSVLGYSARRAASLNNVMQLMPEADATIATSFDTALPVAAFGTGDLFYFMQHFEPYFKDESGCPALAEQEALVSYRLPLKLIANSSWLAAKVESHVPDARVRVCANAIDHQIFNDTGRKPRETNDEVIVISYGGRGARWKGFEEMARAVEIVRRDLPEKKIRWQVYGDALLTPDNDIAPYEPLGFLLPRELAEAYRSADILLSASWYESFPLFPLEAMACGLAVVTTKLGTEEFAINGETAEVVQARNPSAIAAGLKRLIQDIEYRDRVARKGRLKSTEFQWDKSVGRLESIVVPEA